MITDLLATLTSPNVASTATYYSTDHIDLMPLSATAANAGRITNSQIDLGEGQQLYATFTVTTAFAGSTSYTFQIITGTTGVNGGTTAPSNPVVHATTGAILVANAGVGKQFVVPISPVLTQDGTLSSTTGFNRYMALAVVATGGTSTAGIVTANITMHAADGRTSYKSGYTVTTTSVS